MAVGRAKRSLNSPRLVIYVPLAATKRQVHRFMDTGELPLLPPLTRPASLQPVWVARKPPERPAGRPRLSP